MSDEAQKLSQMLHETVQIMESISLTELLPTEVLAWYDLQIVQEAAQEKSDEFQSEKFLNATEDRKPIA